MRTKIILKIVGLAVIIGAVFFVLELIFIKPQVEAPSMRLPSSLPKTSPPTEPPSRF